MTYYNKIKWDLFPGSKVHVFKEIRSRIFFQNYYSIKKNTYIPLSEIINTFGNEDDFMTILNACKRWTQHKLTDMAIVTCYLKEEDIVRDPSVQKLLDFQICDVVTGDLSLVGGVLFQDGKVTFHT